MSGNSFARVVALVRRNNHQKSRSLASSSRLSPPPRSSSIEPMPLLGVFGGMVEDLRQGRRQAPNWEPGNHFASSLRIELKVLLRKLNHPRLHKVVATDHADRHGSQRSDPCWNFDERHFFPDQTRRLAIWMAEAFATCSIKSQQERRYRSFYRPIMIHYSSFGGGSSC